MTPQRSRPYDWRARQSRQTHHHSAPGVPSYGPVRARSHHSSRPQRPRLPSQDRSARATTAPPNPPAPPAPGRHPQTPHRATAPRVPQIPIHRPVRCTSVSGPCHQLHIEGICALLPLSKFQWCERPPSHAARQARSNPRATSQSVTTRSNSSISTSAARV
ncbi:hypothetical protein RUE5091_02882 [Ruegeria denitrificans]|uniref:Uncharacterized protein n=1 Tax=Ruegeria denitrificans TaxID=1715692 RepID=A0A0P1IU14_9RHOB|nr:hypothetical protein RUE5091_02882 [Ruegeria denitrificans]